MSLTILDMRPQVYYANIYTLNSGPLYESALSVIPEDIKNSINRYLHKRDRLHSICGKLLLLKMLKESSLSGLLDLSMLKYTIFKRPYFDHSFDFNISHSGSYVVVGGTSHGKIGVDIEEIKMVDPLEFRNVFTESEIRILMNDLNKTELFYQMWTKKEALAKALGAGLNFPFSQIETNAEDIIIDQTKFKCLQVPLIPGYAFSLALTYQVEDVNVVEVRFDEPFWKE